MRFQSLFWRSRLREWREMELFDAALVLNQLATDLIEQTEADIGALSKHALCLQQATFLSRSVAPFLRAAAEPVMLRLVEQANQRLKELAVHQAIWAERPVDASQDEGFDGWQDVTFAAAPMVGGVAAAVALPAMAVTTTSSWFGLITATTISWPVVVGGSVVAAGLIVTGVWNSAQLVDRLRARLSRKARKLIRTTLIEGGKSPAMLEQFAELLSQSTRHAKRI